jgi:hypothetical protein
MVQVLTSWRIIATLSFASACVNAFDSINLNFEILGEVDLAPLGIPNLDKYQGTYDVTVDSDCQYELKIEFLHDDDNPVPSDSNDFQGSCNPNNPVPASDGLNFHAERKHWMPFPQYVELATGFNHMSLNWKPCGLAPLGLRQPRYDVNFYNVIPQYRVFMSCNEFPTKKPACCQYNQSSYLGRGHFSIPTLHENNVRQFIPNMPVDYQPDPVEPEAYQYEGLVAFDADQVPNVPSNWTLPVFHMSSYDGDVVSFRGLVPYSFASGTNSSFFTGTQFYVFQTENRSPSEWRMTYNSNTKLITVTLQGKAGICGDTFNNAQQAYEDSVDNPNVRRRNQRTAPLRQNN